MKHDDIWALTRPGGLEEETAGPAEGAAARSPLLDAKVMMVDDEPLMTDLIQTHLEDAGYSNFVVTNDPREALAMLHRERPGVLLLDLMMPQLSGFDLLAALRRDRALRYLPVIVLTAATGADSKLRALQLGATDFLSKPVDASELVLRVRNTLAFRQYHERQVNYDAVTGLPNTPLLDQAVGEAIARRPLSGGQTALFVIAVPELQTLRESFGQGAADRLAREFGRRLERFAADAGDAWGGADRASRAARLGPERFGLVLEGLADVAAVEDRVRALIAAVSAAVTLGVHEVVPSAWIGIALAPSDGEDAETLRQAAEQALSRTRQLGTLQYGFASPALGAHAYERLALGLQLRGAAQRGELRLHYQPKMDITGRRVLGAEALVRWQHPERGLVPPGQFIPLAEELGLIGDIGRWVMAQACADAAEWTRAGLGEPKIAINVAKPQFAAGDLVATIRQAMFDSGLPARRIVIELTESMLMDDVKSGVALMHELKELGVTLSIDDFGTGYSSLSYLKTFPLDELKIDRSFVNDLPGRDADRAIVDSVIRLGHSLGMSVTAEGVETPEQLACLRELGCDLVQGYLFSRPLPGPKFFELLTGGAAR